MFVGTHAAVPAVAVGIPAGRDGGGCTKANLRKAPVCLVREACALTVLCLPLRLAAGPQRAPTTPATGALARRLRHQAAAARDACRSGSAARTC